MISRQTVFDPDQPAYLKDGVSMYSETKLTVMGDPNDTGTFEGQVYDLEAIYNHYGVHYAKRLVIAQEKLNDWKISGLFETRWTRLFAKHVAPGHLNYDNVIGTNGAADLPKRVNAEGRLYCEYSDYKSERVNGGPPHDANKPGAFRPVTVRLGRRLYRVLSLCSVTRQRVFRSRTLITTSTRLRRSRPTTSRPTW